MEKVLISFLGTGQPREGEYQSANYSLNGQEHRSAFIAAALNSFLDYEKTILIGTSKSMWENAYNTFVPNAAPQMADCLFDLRVEDNTGIEQLKVELNCAFNDTHVVPVIVKNGVNDEEMYANLMTLFSVLSNLEESEIDIDITHSFRSLPFFLNPSLNFYTTSNKNIQLGNIWYGMFELAGQNNGKAPIVNLTPSRELNELFRCTRSFLDFGNAFPLISHLRSSEYVNQETINHLEKFAKAISLGNANDIVTYARKFNDAVKSEPWKNHLEIVQKEILKGFSDILKIRIEDPKHLGLIAVAKWFKENNMFLHAGIATIEAIRVYIIQNQGIVADNPLPQGQYEYDDVNKKFNKFLKGKNEGIYSLYKKLNKARIRLAHAGVDHPNSTLNDWANLENYIESGTNLENYNLD